MRTDMFNFWISPMPCAMLTKRKVTESPSSTETLAELKMWRFSVGKIREKVRARDIATSIGLSLDACFFRMKAGDFLGFSDSSPAGFDKDDEDPSRRSWQVGPPILPCRLHFAFVKPSCTMTCRTQWPEEIPNEKRMPQGRYNLQLDM